MNHRLPLILLLSVAAFAEIDAQMTEPQRAEPNNSIAPPVDAQSLGFTQPTLYETPTPGKPNRFIDRSSFTEIANARQQAGSGRQIQIRAYYLLVDDETRSWVYQQVAESSFLQQTDARTERKKSDLRAFDGILTSSQVSDAPASASRAVLSAAIKELLLKRVQKNSTEDVRRVPTIVCLEGVEAEMNQVEERPFVIGIEDGDGQSTTQMDVMTAGSRLRMIAFEEPVQVSQVNSVGILSPPKIRLTTEFLDTTIDESGVTEVPNAAGDPIRFQAPIQKTKSVTATARLSAGESLLIDPFVKRQSANSDSKSSSSRWKIPYIGKTFASEKAKSDSKHLLLVISPQGVTSGSATP